MHDALLIAEGILLGGAYLGFDYDFNDVYDKLLSAYEYNKNLEVTMNNYEESYKNYLAWLTPRELLQEYKIMRFPWRYREREWVKEEIERRCVY